MKSNFIPLIAALCIFPHTLTTALEIKDKGETGRPDKKAAEKPEKAKKADNGEADQLTTKDIFKTTNIWSVHLRFTPEQWAEMEAKPAGRPPRLPNGGFQLQGPEGGRNGLTQAWGRKFEYVHGDVEFGDQRFKDVGVRYKGNGTFWSSEAGLKRPLKIDLNHFEKGQKLAGMSQLNLHNSVRDASGMNESIAYRLYRAAGVPAPLTAYAKVYVTVTGMYDRQYLGLYNLVEDISSAFTKEHFKVAKGALLKPVTPAPFTDLGDDWTKYNQTYDPKGDLTDEQKARIIEFCKFTSSATDADFAAKIGDYMDLDNFSRYMAMVTWMSDLDGILGNGQNYYVYLHPGTRKFSFIAWDQDQPFGQFPRGTQPQRDQLNIHQPWKKNHFLERVFSVESFKTAYLARLREFNETIFQPARIQPYVDELTKLLREPIKEESADRLAEFENAIAGRPIKGSTGPGSFTPVSPIKAFLPARIKSVQAQLDGPVVLPPIGSGPGR